eukprot:TRINITY_DN6109_c0_g1_i2.p1 TRINITY_DN6109_c0_g1~~TRINITY_DN6109_c0_g1_i2.p1  ORF type:complete len:116 (-),score=9.33 TRINITY_DN6109_c0_g1_i2:137-484(-)
MWPVKWRLLLHPIVINEVLMIACCGDDCKLQTIEFIFCINAVSPGNPQSQLSRKLMNRRPGMFLQFDQSFPCLSEWCVALIDSYMVTTQPKGPFRGSIFPGLSVLLVIWYNPVHK